jgi:hypothetical protein
MTYFVNGKLEETTELAASPYVRLMKGGTGSVYPCWYQGSLDELRQSFETCSMPVATETAEGRQTARGALLHISECHILIESVHKTSPLYLFCFQFLYHPRVCTWRQKSPAARADRRDAFCTVVKLGG